MSDRFDAERRLLDGWAVWVRVQNAAIIRRMGFPSQDTTSRMADMYGERAGITGKAVQAAPVEYAQTSDELDAARSKIDSQVNDERCEAINRFMLDLMHSDPKAHVCLTARHRRVIGSLNAGQRVIRGRVRAMRESDLAEVCIREGTWEQKRVIFREHCLRGYGMLRRWLQESRYLAPITAGG